jgi:hypothetical protein
MGLAFIIQTREKEKPLARRKERQVPQRAPNLFVFLRFFAVFATS